ncbi:hypothetical protein [Streptomyces vinaceus]|uniref:hypothetical protein n=1 Tax=Streptomyces vinaceus TaxID=1960 RepID=UPI003692885A
MGKFSHAGVYYQIEPLICLNRQPRQVGNLSERQYFTGLAAWLRGRSLPQEATS